MENIINWMNNNPGVADWVSGIGTTTAVIVALISIHRESVKNSLAIQLEDVKILFQIIVRLDSAIKQNHIKIIRFKSDDVNSNNFQKHIKESLEFYSNEISSLIYDFESNVYTLQNTYKNNNLIILFETLRIEQLTIQNNLLDTIDEIISFDGNRNEVKLNLQIEKNSESIEDFNKTLRSIREKIRQEIVNTKKTSA